MSEVKARLIGAITVINESSAQRLWDMVEQLYNAKDPWDAVEEVESDEFDRQMIREAKVDPDCSIFISPAEAINLF